MFIDCLVFLENKHSCIFDASNEEEGWSFSGKNTYFLDQARAECLYLSNDPIH